MFSTIVFLLIGFVILFVGAEGLVRGSSRLAVRFGVAPLIVGLTVVAFGTSSPEIVVSINASLKGLGSLTAGNVIGANMCNIGLILGLAALIRPLAVHAQVVKLEIPILITVTLLMIATLADGVVSQLEGLFLFLGLFVYIFYSVVQAKRGQNKEVEEQFENELAKPEGGLWKDILFVVAGVGLLIFGGDLLLDQAVKMAKTLGVSEAVIGLTVVAIGTTLPELATTVVAAMKKEGDIAVGNAIGSSIFNILGVLGSGAMIRPLEVSGIDGSDKLILLIMVIIAFPLMRSDYALKRGEGAVFLMSYFSYLCYTVFRNV